MSEKKDEKKRVRPADAWRDARALIAANRGRLMLGLALLFVNRAAGFVLPWMSRSLIDEVGVHHRAELLVPMALEAGAATIVQAATSYALAQVLGVAAQRAINDMRKSVQAHVTRLPVRWFDGTQTGVVISRIMTDAEGIRNLVGNGIVQLIGGALTAMVALGVLFWLNWRLTAVILVVLAVFGGAMAFAFKKLRPLFRERGKINAEITGRLAESLGGIRVVKAYAAESHEERVFAAGADRYFGNVSQSMRGVSRLTAFSVLIIGVVGVLMILVGGDSLAAGTMTTGDFMMYLLFVGMVVMPVVEIANISTQITEAFAGLDRIREIRSMATENADDAARAPCADVAGDVAFDGVSFAYEPGKPVLRDISFRTPAGTTTALVGSSGSGKSTLVGLVMAFHQPLSGRVTVDGRDLSELRLGDYRAHLGVVLQDNFLFDGTIAENVAFSRPGAAREAVEAACRTAHCDEFVLRFEKGYDTIVGERGVKLSGGQRQRVAIARALLAEPKILILDEATSSLDSETEAMIQDGLQALRKSRTTFVIAHRLSTIRSADQILVLEGGEIVERGTHAELFAAGGRYRQLHDRQYRFEEDRFINPGEDFTPEPERPKVPKIPAPR